MPTPLKQRLILAETNIVEHYPRRGRPLAAPAPTFTVFGAGDDALTAIDATLEDATATLDSFSATVDADASRGSRELTLSTTANLFVGDRYWLTNERGQSEEVMVDGFDSAKAYLVDALSRDYDADATPKPKLEGMRMTASISDTLLTEIVRGGRIVWTYYYRTGEALHDAGYYDVMLQDADWPVTANDFRKAWHAFIDHVGDDLEWRRLADGARELLETRLESSCLYADLLQNPRYAAQYIVAKTIERYLGSNASQFEKELDYWTRQSEVAFGNIDNYLRLALNSDNPLEIAFA